MVFKTADVTIDRIVEQQAPLFDPLTFFPGATPELLAENREWLNATALDPATGLVILCIQSYVVRTPHHTILVDTCVGNDKDRPNHQFWSQMRGTQYMEGLAAIGLTVEDIDFVLCTHLHIDHVGWNTRLLDGRWVPTFPNAKYVFAKAELDYWTSQPAQTPWLVDSVLPIVAAGREELVADDHVLNEFVRLEPTPGHTPHHFAVQIGRGQTDAVLTGDLIHSPLQMRFPEISMRADFDQKQSAVTRRRFLECYCDTQTLVCTSHFPLPSTGHVTRHGAGFAFKST
jgi:glyoxylase-like metal-dependent hydrolase (beta-lactamase superfamily II)